MKNEKKAWILLFGFVFIIAASLGFFNLTVDSANQLHFCKNNEKKVAEAIMNGQPVYFINHPNERLCKEELIKILPDHFDTVAIGASLLMTVNKEMLGLENGEFYNLGVSGMNLKDYMNTLGMMKYYGKEADNYIFLLHIDVFLPNDDGRKEIQKQYGAYYLDYLNGKDSQIKSNFLFNTVKDELKTFFSVSYFQENLQFYREHGLRKSIMIGGNHPEHHYMSDASWVYSEEYQSRSVKDVIEDIKNRGAEYMPKTHVDKENFILFDRIIHDLLKQGKKIILYFPPYCPSLYAAYPPQNSPCFKEIEDFISRYKNEENITILGSFYPQKCGLSDENFYDARHIRREDMPLAFRKIY